MEQFLQDILAGASPQGVVDLCLDHVLVRNEAPQQWTQLADLSAWQDLEVLSISGHQLTTLDGLPALPRLRQLCLSLNALESLADFPALPALAELDLSHNLLETLDGLPPMPGLRTLHLGHNHLRDTAWAAGFPGLRALTLSGNRGIKGLEDLQGLLELEALYVRQCFVTRWKGLYGMQRLGHLAASPVSLLGLEVLATLPALHTLHVQAKALTGVWALPPMPALRHLHIVGGGGLEVVEGLAGMPDLEELVLRGNGLTAVPDLAGLPRLRLLDLSDNPLRSGAGLERLAPEVEVRLVNTGLGRRA